MRTYILAATREGRNYDEKFEIGPPITQITLINLRNLRNGSPPFNTVSARTLRERAHIVDDGFGYFKQAK
jgi:hypothetical protein